MLIKDNSQNTVEANIEFKKDFDEGMLFLKVEVLQDMKESSRKYENINELYYKHEFESVDLKVGKDIKYWGSLELHNISDIYNEKNIENDAFNKDKKLGTSGLTLSYFMANDDEISLIVSEDKTKTNDADVFIKYSGSRDDIASRDFSYILSNKNEQLLMYHTLINENTIYKLEYKYENKLKKYELGIGTEHTLYGIVDKKDLGLLLEYYKSDKLTNYQNDLFLAIRYSFNDESSSDILSGIINNRDDDKYTYSFEFNTRIANSYKIKINYLKNDALDVASIKLHYHF